MPNIQILSRDRHAGKRWQRYTSYAHTAADAVAHLVLPELSRACVAMPIGFIRVQGGYAPVAVQGLEPGRNACVADDGRWLADYIPAAYRSHPFALGISQTGQPVLCIDEDSSLLSDTKGELFYDKHGEPTSFLKDILDFMVHVARQRRTTQRICAVLEKFALLEPWPIRQETDAGPQTNEGLHRIDKTALKNLSAAALHELKLAGALPVIYCQLLSTQHVPKLVRLTQRRAADRAAAPLAPAGDLDLEFLNNGGTISFGDAAHLFMHGCEVNS
ncbi:SapC family protein [Alcaligenaceae bacterium]|nr:SapC family protein [Alcaligenaceae bacterium]